MSRSTKRSDLTLKAYDRDHAGRAIFPNALSPMDAVAKPQNLPAASHGSLRRGLWQDNTARRDRVSSVSLMR